MPSGGRHPGPAVLRRGPEAGEATQRHAPDARTTASTGAAPAFGRPAASLLRSGVIHRPAIHAATPTSTTAKGASTTSPHHREDDKGGRQGRTTREDDKGGR